MSGQKTVSEYYSVSFKPFDAPGDGALLASVRRKYFLGGRTVSGSLHAVESGQEVRARYRVGKGSFRWRKTCGHSTLQESFRLSGGNYRLVSHDLQGRIVSANTFDGSLRWMQTAYYDGDPSKPAAVLTRGEQGVSLLEYDPRAERYVKQELFPCEMEPGTAVQSYIDGTAGEPRVLAQTDAGIFCLCTEKECGLRRSLRERIAKNEDFLTPEWPKEERQAPLDFQVVENDPSALRSAALKKASELKNKQAADCLLASGEYAADHEIFLSAAPRQQSEEPTKPVAPVSTKYAVAAKGLSGSVVHAAGLGKISSSEPGPLIPAKRIVVSSMESYQYFGKLLDGLREGQGRTQMLDGHTAYEGGYREDMRDGFGVYYYKSGKICYVGGWRRNLRNGMGVAFGSKDGSIFVGHWENNVATGSGSAFDLEGNLIYTGGWKNGKRHGHGTEYCGGRIVRVGEWEEDRFCSGYRHVGKSTEEPGA